MLCIFHAELSLSYEGGDSELFYYLKSMIPENCEHFVYSF